MAKQIKTGEEARKALETGVNTLAKYRKIYYNRNNKRKNIRR